VVVHQEIGFVYFSGDAEAEPVAPIFRIINDARQTEWTPGNDYRPSIEIVIHNLMPVQNPDGVRFRDSVVLDRQDSVVLLEKPITIGRRDEFRIV